MVEMAASRSRSRAAVILAASAALASAAAGFSFSLSAIFAAINQIKSVFFDVRELETDSQISGGKAAKDNHERDKTHEKSFFVSSVCFVYFVVVRFVGHFICWHLCRAG